MKEVRQVSVIFAVAGLFFFSVYAQDYPFSDDFSNPAQTNSQWGKWYGADTAISAVCTGGVYTITDRHQDNMPALFYHGFATATASFTASCVVTRSSGAITAGMVLCLSAFPNLNGYAIVLDTTETACVARVWIVRWVSNSGVSVWNAEYHQQNSSSPSDTLMVSKQGGTFTIFCNGVYLGSYTDASPLAAGNIGLIVEGNFTAAFDDVQFTDQFTSGSFPAVFRDNFNNGEIEKQWLLRDCSNFTEHDLVLDITAPPPVSNGVFAEVKMTIDTFYSMLIVSHRSGDSSAFYGFYLRGPDTLDTFRAALFGISGQSAGGAYLSTGGSVFYPPPGWIRGKAFVNGPNDTTFYQDTIEVRRTSGSSLYIMNINRHPLDTLTTAQITYPIIGAGIYAGGGQNVFADYFAVGLDSSITGVKNIAKDLRYVKGLKFSPMTSRYLFNPLGRVVGRKDASGRLNGRFVAPGFYITEQKKSGIIMNKEVR
jgi:hypothetical protein